MHTIDKTGHRYRRLVRQEGRIAQADITRGRREDEDTKRH